MSEFVSVNQPSTATYAGVDWKSSSDAPPLVASVAGVHDDLVDLDSVVARLAEKLDPVLRLRTDEDEKLVTVDAGLQIAGPRSALRQQMDDRREHIAGIRQRLNDLLRRVDL
jgi:hypothetical protein